MPLTDADLKAYILADINDDGTAEDQWAAIWERAGIEAGLRTSAPDVKSLLQEAYAKKRALGMLLGSLRNKINASVQGDTFNLKQQFDNALAMMATITDTVMLIEQRTSASSRAAIGQMNTTQPIDPPAGWPDGNDPVYRGTPYGTVRAWRGDL